MTQLPIRSLKPVFIAAVLGAMCVAGSAQAQDACSGFKWPVQTEMAWVTSSDAEAVKSGGDIAALPARAIELKLEPSPDAKLPVASGIKKQAVAPGSFSGWFTLAGVPKPGVYQVSLSHHGWIDLAQNGELIQSTAFTGSKDCKTLRKSVRFEIGAGPVVVQVVGVDVDTIRVTVHEADGK